jgi:hypothetical protein
MMFEALYLFLIRHKQLILPEIGTITIQMQPARTQFVERTVLPPEFSFNFSPISKPISNKFFSWLSHQLGVPESEAIVSFNDFALLFKNDLENGKIIQWNRLGRFSRNSSNEIIFHPEEKDFLFFQPVHAEKVLRENVKHHLIVGEKERTASDLSEVLHVPETLSSRRDQWWIWPVAIIVILTIYIAWFLSENGSNASPTGNTQFVTPTESSSGFYFLP